MESELWRRRRCWHTHANTNKVTAHTDNTAAVQTWPPLFGMPMVAAGMCTPDRILCHVCCQNECHFCGTSSPEWKSVILFGGDILALFCFFLSLCVAMRGCLLTLCCNYTVTLLQVHSDLFFVFSLWCLLWRRWSETKKKCETETLTTFRFNKTDQLIHYYYYYYYHWILIRFFLNLPRSTFPLEHCENNQAIRWSFARDTRTQATVLHARRSFSLFLFKQTCFSSGKMYIWCTCEVTQPAF